MDTGDVMLLSKRTCHKTPSTLGSLFYHLGLYCEKVVASRRGYLVNKSIKQQDTEYSVITASR